MWICLQCLGSCTKSKADLISIMIEPRYIQPKENGVKILSVWVVHSRAPNQVPPEARTKFWRQDYQYLKSCIYDRDFQSRALTWAFLAKYDWKLHLISAARSGNFEADSGSPFCGIPGPPPASWLRVGRESLWLRLFSLGCMCSRKVGTAF